MFTISVSMTTNQLGPTHFHWIFGFIPILRKLLP